MITSGMDGALANCTTLSSPSAVMTGDPQACMGSPDPGLDGALIIVGACRRGPPALSSDQQSMSV